ncbi:GTP-binding protein REM 1 [Thalassophryne amazonica]|uniref:GTP-binding protein REM 1 n=1 Tax=Thalassophryne amazonica TaxID=390379 RepID=UPI0014713DB1|nr:GTP-binding protein REM 1 [Thalassophryne amazonica]
MTLNTRREKEALHCRSTPLFTSTRSHQCPPYVPHIVTSGSTHPQQRRPIGQSTSCHPAEKSLSVQAQWSCEPDDRSRSKLDSVYHVVLLGDRRVGKTSLAGIFSGKTEKDEKHKENMYERTLTVDGEETTLVVMDTWEKDKQEEESGSQDACLRVGSAYIIVYSVTDRSSFDAAAELRITLRRARQAENLPIILVGNKTDLVRSREVAVEEGQACAVVFDCKFIETSASLQHNVAELFEGVVRQIRLRQDDSEPVSKRKVSITQKALHFLDQLVVRNNQRMAAKFRSKSCRDLAVL